jgi:hypothetical protein
MNNFVGDGNGYIGNADLKPEVAHTLSASGDWHDAAQKEWGVKAGRGKQVRAEVCVGETSGAFEVKGQIQIQMFPEADSFEIFRW